MEDSRSDDQEKTDTEHEGAHRHVVFLGLARLGDLLAVHLAVHVGFIQRALLLNSAVGALLARLH